MKINLIIFIIIFFINESQESNSNRSCSIDHHDCKKEYDLNNTLKIVCKNSKCHNSYKHSCGSIYCSKSESDCKILLFFRRKLISLTLISNHFSGISFSDEIKKYQVFVKSFKKCAPQPLELKRTDVCMKAQD